MTERIYKGKSLLAFPRDYVVVDIETTGLSPAFCEILEISAMRCRDHQPCEEFSTLIRPEAPIPRFITGLTGISDRMVKDAPHVADVIGRFARFAGDDVLLGYNVNFDVNFLYDNLLRFYGVPLKNDFVDVLRFARRALKDLPNHSLGTVAGHYGVSYDGAHRALADCAITNACYLRLMREEALCGIPRL